MYGGSLRQKRSRSRLVGGDWGGGQWVLEEEKVRMKQNVATKRKAKKKKVLKGIKNGKVAV